MTWLEVLVGIIVAGGDYVPRTKGPPPRDPADGPGWILGTMILVAVVAYLLIGIIAK